MKNKILFLLSVIGLLVFAGCANLRNSVPATQITGTAGGKPFSFTGPKDLQLGWLQITADTNGAVSLTLSNLVAKTNPDVITTTAAGQAVITAAQADAVIKAFQAGVAGVAALKP
jgi:hypothetical protein